MTNAPACYSLRIMLIAQISDTHLDPKSEHHAARIRDLERTVAAINALDPLPDAVIHTGDMAHNGTPEKYALAHGILAGLKAPLHVVRGNRDQPDLLYDAFPSGRRIADGSGFLFYSVDDYPVRVLVVDTTNTQSNMGDFCAGRLDVLRSALAEQSDKPTVLAMHHPPFEVMTSKYVRQFDDWDAVARLSGAIKDHAQVIRILCGHAHRDAGGVIAGVAASSIPSVAIDLRLGDFAPEMEESPLFQLHRFDDAGAVATEIRAA
ncbi:MAG: metallophosphoesterase [Rhodospirillaceae bacterium]